MTGANVAPFTKARKKNRRVNLKKIAAQHCDEVLRLFPSGVAVTIWGRREVVSRAILRAVFMAYAAHIYDRDLSLPPGIRGLVWPGLALIAEIACVSESQARVARAALRKLGLLDWIGGPGGVGQSGGMNPCLTRVIYGPALQKAPPAADRFGLPAYLRDKRTSEIIASLEKVREVAMAESEKERIRHGAEVARMFAGEPVKGSGTGELRVRWPDPNCTSTGEVFDATTGEVIYTHPVDKQLELDLTGGA